jgi:hypothetical protein
LARGRGSACPARRRSLGRGNRATHGVSRQILSTLPAAGNAPTS